MTINRLISIMAGFFIMLSLALGVELGGSNPLFMHEYWLGFTAFVGFNLFQSGITGFCPAAIIFKKLGFANG